MHSIEQIKWMNSPEGLRNRRNKNIAKIIANRIINNTTERKYNEQTGISMD